MKELKTVYIVVTQTGTVFSKLLKVFTQDPYNHVSISFEDDLSLMYSFARRKINRPWIAGFIEENPEEGIFARQSQTICEVHRLQLTTSQFNQLQQSLVPFLTEAEKYRYNFLGLPFMWMGVPFQRRYHYVCSQFIAHLLDEAYVVAFEKSTSLIRPSDFTQLVSSEKIYEGRLHDFISPLSCPYTDH